MVKIFSAENPIDLQSLLSMWLKEHDGDVDVMQMLFASKGDTWAVLVWYTQR